MESEEAAQLSDAEIATIRALTPKVRRDHPSLEPLLPWFDVPVPVCHGQHPRVLS